MDKKTIEKVDLKGKRVFIRADFNVPLDENGNITDDGRIRSTLPTINYALDAGAKVILASHLGRPKGKPNPKYSLAPVALRLNRLLNKEVKFAKDCIGPDVEHLVQGMRPGDVLLLENLRFHAEEEKNDEGFSKALAAFTDVYVNDAFGTAHRAHASTYGITKFVKQSVAGFLMKKEIDYLQKTVANPVRPFVAILGGAKVSGKIGVIENLQNKVDKIIVGGAMAFTFIKARGQEVGQLARRAGHARDGPAHQKERPRKGRQILSARGFCRGREHERRRGDQDRHVPGDPEGMGRASTSARQRSVSLPKRSRMPRPSSGTAPWACSRRTPTRAAPSPSRASVADAYATTIVGGGDTDVAVHKAGVSDSITFISTGGGASLELLEGKELPGLAALTDDKE